MRQNALKIYVLIKDKLRGLSPDKYQYPDLGNGLNRLKVSDNIKNEMPQIYELCKIKELLTMFLRIGLVKNTRESNPNRDRLKKIFDDIISNSNDDLETVTMVLLSFCRKESNHKKTGICADIPRCKECSLTSFCSYWNKRPSIKQLPEMERPRERLIHKGEEHLSDAELLGIIIRDGTPNASAVDVARKVLSKFGNFRELGSKTISELCRIEGIGEAKAAQIKAAIAIAKRYSTITLKPGVKFSSSNAIFKHFHETLRDKKQETFLAVLLDNKNRILKEKHISTGSLTASIVHPREVFEPAIREHAASVVFVHNHPSGDPRPSNEDIEITKRLKEVSSVVGIKILDHVIIGDAEYVSLRDEGLL